MSHIMLAGAVEWATPSDLQAAPPPPPAPPEFIDAYIGFAPMEEFTDDGDLWIRRGSLQIHGSRLTLHTAPLVCRGHEIYASESDGGFFEYAGTLSGPPEARVAVLQYVGCDLCIRKRDATPETYRMAFRIVDDGTVSLGGVAMERRNPPFPYRCPSTTDGTALPPELPEQDKMTP